MKEIYKRLDELKENVNLTEIQIRRLYYTLKHPCKIYCNEKILKTNHYPSESDILQEKQTNTLLK